MTSTASSALDTLSILRKQEAEAIVHRRELASGKGVDTEITQLPTVGLALSGGGVRSATFALGLLRGLAQSGDATALPEQERSNHLRALERVDYLSTVSGGGFVGSMYGRLISSYGIGPTVRELAKADSTILEWLRRNGRYLTPAGLQDVKRAMATYFRAYLTVYIDFAFACVFVSIVVRAD